MQGQDLTAAFAGLDNKINQEIIELLKTISLKNNE
jgi:hypothetical protein